MEDFEIQYKKQPHMKQRRMQNAGGLESWMNQRRDGFWMRMLKGAIIGIAAILPGASGGVIAVSLGVYRPVIDAVVGFFHAIKRNTLFLLPLGIGGVIGLFATSRLVEWLIANWKMPVMYALIGMVLGGVPSFMVEANQHGFKKRYLLGTAFGIALILLFAAGDRLLTDGQAWPFTMWTAALAGVLIALGTVIPGISTSFILMYMGLYEPLLSALNRFDIPVMACVAVGAGATVLATIAFVKRMFDRHHGYAYYTVLGLLAGSIVLIFPGFSWSWIQVLCVALFAGGFAATYFLCRNSGS